MATLWNNYWKILTLKREPFEGIGQSPRGFRFALQLFILVSLIASLGKLVPAGEILQRTTLASRFDSLAASLEAGANSVPRFLSGPIQNAAEAVDEIGERLSALQPPLGVRFSQLIRLVGEWLAVPFNFLASWMSALVLVWVVARLMGGQGALETHFSLCLLAIAPFVLTFQNFLPGGAKFLGGVFNLAAAVWALLIGLQALSVAHGVSKGRALGIMVVSLLISSIIISSLVAAVVGGLLAWLF
jgi:hypothetical protein